MVASLLLAASGAAGASPCEKDEVPWQGGCFDRYQWDTDEKTCPDGVIVIPEDEDRPRCVPCEGYAGMQQPINYCAGLVARQTEVALKETLEEVVKRLPDREKELRAAQNAWLKSRAKACRAEEKEYEGGSMAPEIFSYCVSQRGRKRIVELKAMMSVPAPAAPVLACGGDAAPRTLVDHRASVGVAKSRFYAEARACPPQGDCPWLRKGYLVRGDQVSETAISGEFACVTYKTTTGWLPLRDLCEKGAPCDATASSGVGQPSKKAASPIASPSLSHTP